LLLWEDEEEVPKRLFDFFKCNLKPDLLVFRNNHRWENEYYYDELKDIFDKRGPIDAEMIYWADKQD
jgi:hypothetical protein